MRNDREEEIAQLDQYYNGSTNYYDQYYNGSTNYYYD